MPTRLQRLRRLLIFSPVAAALVGASALSLSTVQAATPQTGCTVNLLGICVVPSPTPAPTSAPALPLPATVPPAPVPTSAGSAPPPCIATLLSLCVPNGAGVGGTTQCVAGSTACVTVPSGCVGNTCPPGTGLPNQPPGGTGNLNGGSSGSGSQSGSGSAAGTPGSASTTAGASLSGAFGSGSAAPGAQQTAAFGSVTTPAIPTSGEFAGLGGLRLGAMMLWPVFAVLDVLAVAAIVILARRSWLAAPGD